MSSAHEVLSRRVLLPLMRGQALVRPSRRPSACAYREGMRFRRRARRWTDDERRAWIVKRLRVVVRRAARETAYYPDLFQQAGFDPWSEFDFDDFATVPVLERDDVRRAGTALVSTTVAPGQLTKDATGGSSGAPTEVWVGPDERGWRESGIDFSLARTGVLAGSRVGLLWGHHLDPVGRDHVRRRFHDFVANARWFDCFRLSPEILDRYHRELDRWRPTVVIAYASALAALAEHVLEHRYLVKYPRHCFVTGAEKLYPGQREWIDRAFGKPIHERYGSRDVGPIGIQVDPSRTLDYDVDWANVLVEPEDDGNETAILVTKLHADGMPMIRYRTGDLGRFGSPSAPGHPTFVLHEVVGRDVDFLWLPDGRRIHSIQFPHLMKDHPVIEFTVLQRPDYSVEIQLVPRTGFDEVDRQRILQAATDNLPGIPVELVLVDQIPRTRASKLRPVVSQVSQAARSRGLL